MTRTFKAIALALALMFTLSACTTDADKVNENLATAAEQFEITRRIVGINGITGDYLIEVVGRCSVEAATFYEIICKIGPDEYERHLIGHSDNTTMVVEQLEPVDADEYRTRVIFKPEGILPAPDLEASFYSEDEG